MSIFCQKGKDLSADCRQLKCMADGVTCQFTVDNRGRIQLQSERTHVAVHALSRRHGQHFSRSSYIMQLANSR